MATRLLAAAMATAALAAFPQAAAGQAADAPRFELVVQPRSGTTSDTFTVSVRIETRDFARPESVTPPRFDDFDVGARHEPPGRVIQRGAYPRYVQLRRYVLKPKRAGTFTLGPARMRVRGRDYATQRVRVTVRDANRSGTAPAVADPTSSGGVGAPGYTVPVPPAEDDMFLHAVVDKTSAYVGEQVTVTWLVFTRGQLGYLNPRTLRLNDWWAETLYQPRRNYAFHATTIGDTSYQVAIVSKRALFASKAGKLVIPQLEADASLAYRSIRRRLLLAPTPAVDVKELPPNAPAGFDPSYVGSFKVEATVNGKVPDPGKRIEIGPGAAVLLTLKVSGTGAVARTTAPAIAAPGFRFGKPRDSSMRSTTRDGVVSGERTYRYWSAPQRSGAQQIPAIKVTYFDPAAGKYLVAETTPIALLVKAGGGSGVDLTSREDRLAAEMRAIRTGSINHQSVSHFNDSGWFWLLALIPPLGFLGLMIYQRVRRVMEQDTPKSRQRRARSRARKRFKSATKHLADGNDRELFTELARLIYESLEYAVGEPVRSLTRPQLRRLLTERGFEAELVERIDSELERFDFARFAPAGSDEAEMTRALERTEELVAAIRDKSRLATEDGEASA